MTSRFSRRDFLRLGVVTVGSGILIPALSACVPAAAPAPEQEAAAESAAARRGKGRNFCPGLGQQLWFQAEDPLDRLPLLDE